MINVSTMPDWLFKVAKLAAIPRTPISFPGSTRGDRSARLHGDEPRSRWWGGERCGKVRIRGRRSDATQALRIHAAPAAGRGRCL